MELSPRKQAVLKAIVKAYIESGEPIGSKNLVALLENAPSSATLRNEMSELCELGLLRQPHTSAGRVPTSNGYKVYVNHLMQNAEISSEIANYIDNAFNNIHCEIEAIPAAAAKTLSEIFALPAISCLLTKAPPIIKKVEFLPIGKSSVMLLIITNDGRTRNTIFRYGNQFSAEAKIALRQLIEKRIIGEYANKLTKAYMQSAIAETGIYSLELMPLLTAIFELAANIEDADLTLSGETALYNICGDEARARSILSLIKQRDPMISILKNVENTAGAVFGFETIYNELLEDTIIAAKFSGTDKYNGYLGIIGPNRMSYEQIMPVMEYTAQKLTNIMAQAGKDMED